jgi:hypothetical protein
MKDSVGEAGCKRLEVSSDGKGSYAGPLMKIHAVFIREVEREPPPLSNPREIALEDSRGRLG